jgi:hypothetical protein
LGAVLYSRVTLAVADALPKVSTADRATLVHDITAGKLSGATLDGYDASSLKALATVSFASGYHALFLAGALFMLISTILTWRLVSPAETPPTPASSARPQSTPSKSSETPMTDLKGPAYEHAGDVSVGPVADAAEVKNVIAPLPTVRAGEASANHDGLAD